MPGPAPKDPAQRRRRNASGAVKTLLPAEGRKGATPRWPLKLAKPDVWPVLWRMPHAVAWERASLVRVVARYALLLELAESLEASTAVMLEVRQLEDRLGLNPKAMRSLLWEISSDEVGEKRAQQSEEAPAEVLRSRLKVV